MAGPRVTAETRRERELAATFLIRDHTFTSAYSQQTQLAAMNNEGTLADVRCVTNLLYITHFQPTVYIDYQLLRVLSIQILLTSSIHVTKAATITCDHLYCIPVPQSTFLRSTTILRHSTRAPSAQRHRPGGY